MPAVGHIDGGDLGKVAGPSMHGHVGAVDAYAEQCRRCSMSVDPSVAIWLRFGGESLQISGNIPYEGCLLPMYDFIAESMTLRRLSLHVPSAYRARGTGNSNARVLRYVLSVNKTLEELNLQAAGIDHEGLVDLCEGLRHNSTLRVLNLRGNFLGPKGGRVLVDFVALTLRGGGSGVRSLDVSYSSIGFNAAQCLMRLTGRTVVDSRVPHVPTEGTPVVQVMGNFETEELWNAVTHGLMFLLSILGSVLLLHQVVASPVHHIWGCALFCFGLLFMFLSSTLYHSLFLYPGTTRVFQVLDHCAIFVLIAGSYSPFLLFYSTQPHLNLLKVEWVLCGAGVVMHVCSQYAKWGTSRFYITVELCLYLCMGWGAVGVWDSLTKLLPKEAFHMLLGGGLLYTAGVPFFVLGDYRPIFHTIWHLFVAGAAICHWFSVKAAAVDALEHHSEGPFIPEIQRWNNTFSVLKDEIDKLRHGAQDHGVYGTLRSLQRRIDTQALLLTGLAGAWGNSSLLERLSSSMLHNISDGGAASASICKATEGGC
mmetsp:Transcript_26043/g.82309  ORF Transcript_26043/g.82309 Transcript_26043/m.82309 type:complete len:537 (-) Transcript_26043:165-1775(-)